MIKRCEFIFKKVNILYLNIDNEKDGLFMCVLFSGIVIVFQNKLDQEDFAHREHRFGTNSAVAAATFIT